MLAEWERLKLSDVCYELEKYPECRNLVNIERG